MSATYTVAVSGDDGFARKQADPVYPPSTSTTVNDSSGNIFVQRLKSGADYQITVGLARWDTSAELGNTASDGTLRMWVDAKTDADGLSLELEWYTLGSPIATGDYTATPSSSAGSFPLTGITAGAYNDFALTGPDAGINKAGYTGLRMHLSAATPTGDNGLQIHSYDDGSHNAPQLLVTSAPTPLGSPTNAFFHMLGR